MYFLFFCCPFLTHCVTLVSRVFSVTLDKGLGYKNLLRTFYRHLLQLFHHVTKPLNNATAGSFSLTSSSFDYQRVLLIARHNLGAEMRDMEDCYSN